MKPQNNLPPESQRWVRDLEKRVQDLERANAQVSELNRRQDLALASTTKAVSEIRETQIIQVSQLAMDSTIQTTTGAVSDSTGPRITTTSLTIEAPEWASSYSAYAVFETESHMSDGYAVNPYSVHQLLGLYLNSGPSTDAFRSVFCEGLDTTQGSYFLSFHGSISDYRTVTATLDTNLSTTGIFGTYDEEFRVFLIVKWS
jgi:hypothetical protein